MSSEREGFLWWFRHVLLAVIFDLHWTLIRSTIDFLRMKRKLIDVWVSHGVDRVYISEELKNDIIIDRGRAALKAKGVSDLDIASMMRRSTDVMNRVELEHVAETTSMQDAVKTLRWLQRRGVRVGVITRSCRAYAETALRVVGMTELVDVLLARDDVDHPEPDPRHLLQLIDDLGCAPQHVLLVGDSTVDASCAQRAGVRFIGVLSGITSEQQLKQFPNHAILPGIFGLTSLLQRDIDVL